MLVLFVFPCQLGKSCQSRSQLGAPHSHYPRWHPRPTSRQLPLKDSFGIIARGWQSPLLPLYLALALGSGKDSLKYSATLKVDSRDYSKGVEMKEEVSAIAQ